MQIKPNDLTGRLAQQLDCVYLISGDDPLLVDEACDAIRQRAYKEGFSGRDVHIVERGFDWSEVTVGGSNMSLFDDRQLTEIRIPNGKPGRNGSAAMVELVSHIHADDCLLVIVPKLDASAKKSAWVKALTARGVMVQFWPISAQDLPRWIAGRLQQQGLEASRDAVLMLADRSQGNLLAAQQEITKLSLQFDTGKISAEDVAKSVADSARFDVFQLSDAALMGDTRRSLRILEGLKAEGVEPVLILWALGREIRTLATICYAMDNGGSVDAAMNAARVWSSRKALIGRAAQRVGRASRAHELLALAATTDAAVKGQGPGNPWSGLKSILVGLCHRGPTMAVA
ncbi:MAG: DNA polymerase III subunit delta [Gammaproteobacteria bacterium]